jgi:hypothetical protein
MPSAWLFVAIWLIYVLTSPGDLTGDSDIRWAVAGSIVTHGWVDIPLRIPPHRAELFEAAQFLSRNAPPEAVVAFDPKIGAMDMARRWALRRSLLADTSHGSMAYTDQQALGQVQDSIRSAFESGFSDSSANELSRWGATHALLMRDHLAAPMTCLFQNQTYAVVLIDKSQSGCDNSTGPP